MIPISQRLRRELRVWQRLDHENILPLSGITYHFGYVSMVCPWQENGNLQQYLECCPDTRSLSPRLEIVCFPNVGGRAIIESSCIDSFVE